MQKCELREEKPGDERVPSPSQRIESHTLPSSEDDDRGGGGCGNVCVLVHLFGSLHGITGGVSDLRGRLGVDLIVELKQKIRRSVGQSAGRSDGGRADAARSAWST